MWLFSAITSRLPHGKARWRVEPKVGLKVELKVELKESLKLQET